MWAQLSGDWRRLASDGNAPRLNQSSTSLTIGGDAAVGGGAWAARSAIPMPA